MSHHILLVEDDWFLADIVAATLRDRGWMVHTAATVADAVATALQAPPDLVLMDLRLPDGDGWSAIAQVRSIRQERRIPVVVVSSSPVTRRELRQYEVAAYVPKPFRMPDLLERVSALLAPA